MTLPGPGTLLELEAADGTVVAARVISHLAAGALVDWIETALETGDVTARWGTERGLKVLPCRLTSDGEYAALEPAGEPQQVQRRRAVRVEVMVPVRRLDPGADDEEGVTINVSATGLLVSGGLSLEVGDETTLAVHLPDQDEPMKVAGRVRRTEDPDILGIELVGLRPVQEDRLVHLVFEHQRNQLRRRSGAPRLRLVEGY